MTATPAVVFSFGYHRWADPFTGGPPWPSHRMAAGLIDDPTVPDLLVADSYRSRLARLRGPARAWRQGFREVPGRRLAHPERWRRLDPHSSRRCVAAYRTFDTWLLRGAQGMRAPVLVTCHPVHAAVADRTRWSDVVYYGWDDWRSYPPYARIRPLLDWAYREIAAQDTHVVGVTNAIIERVGARRGTVVPNATTADEYDDLPSPPSWFDRTAEPIAFYAGSLQERVDLPVLLRTAEELPSWSFCVVGPVRNSDLFTGLSLPPNVMIRPPVPRAEVLAMAARSQVCLIPHRRTEMSEAMSPLKLYEYLGSGTPVVATDLPPIREAGSRALLVEPGESLASAINKAAALAPQPTADLHRWRLANDWSARYAAFRDAVLARS